MKSFTKGLIILAFIACSINTKAQIGINNSDPDPSAILDIKHDTKGVLFPRISNSTFLDPPGEDDDVAGMFFYATGDNKFYYYNGTNWQCLNPFSSTGVDNARLNGDLTVQGNLDVEPESTISGYGTIPIGGIIMWSGPQSDMTTYFNASGMGKAGTKMDGWALCNNQNDTPDLRGRFVVGYNPSDVDYDVIGSPAGEKKHTLTANESGLPNHAHTMNHTHSITDPGHTHGIKTGRNGGNGEITKEDEDNSATKTTNSATTGITINTYSGNTGSKSQNASQAHENRPPYYVIAYIIRVK